MDDESLKSWGYEQVGQRPDIEFDCDECGAFEYFDGQWLAMYRSPKFGTIYCENCLMEYGVDLMPPREKLW